MQEQNIASAGRRSTRPTRSQTDLPFRVLLVDDDSAMRQLGAEALTRCGYQVETAEDGEAGWEKLRANTYDLLITDNRMPKVSGVELVEMLRSARLTLPVIMVSDSIPLEALNGAASPQLAATLDKPFTTEELLGTVENALRETEEARGRTVHFSATGGAA